MKNYVSILLIILLTTLNTIASDCDSTDSGSNRSPYNPLVKVFAPSERMMNISVDVYYDMTDEEKKRICNGELLDLVTLSRHFTFFQDGRFTVTTVEKKQRGGGKRENYILPTSNKLEEIEDGEFIGSIRSADGNQWIFSANDRIQREQITRVQDIENCEYIESETNYGPQNKNGFELKSCKNKVIIDLGFTNGNTTPCQNLSGTAIIRDQYGQSCQIQRGKVVHLNKDICTLKYKESVLASIIKSIPSCEKLDLSPLK